MVTAVEPLHVLVVEDEAVIRMLAVDVLEEAGFAVIEAAGADEAIKLLEVHAPKVHVIFSDIQMPGTIGGVELARHVKAHWPWIGVLLTSARGLPAGIPSDILFVSKPYNIGHVMSSLHLMAAPNFNGWRETMP